jgi:hypothetical protein
VEWLCKCGNPVTTAEFLWHWRNAADIGHKTGRYVCYGLRLGCNECISGEHDVDSGAEYQYIEISLSAQTKQALVNQLLAEALREAPWGYIPKTDIQKALRSIRAA